MMPTHCMSCGRAYGKVVRPSIQWAICDTCYAEIEAAFPEKGPIYVLPPDAIAVVRGGMHVVLRDGRVFDGVQSLTVEGPAGGGGSGRSVEAGLREALDWAADELIAAADAMEAHGITDDNVKNARRAAQNARLASAIVKPRRCDSVSPDGHEHCHLAQEHDGPHRGPGPDGSGWASPPGPYSWREAMSEITDENLEDALLDAAREIGQCDSVSQETHLRCMYLKGHGGMHRSGQNGWANTGEENR